MKIYLIRHGETEYNQKGLTQGWCDSHLTENGIEQANELGKALQNIRFSKVYAGDCTRQYSTAEHILYHNKMSETRVIKTKAFREICFGRYEGSNYEKMLTKYYEDDINNGLSFWEAYQKSDVYNAFVYLAENDSQNSVEHPRHVFERFVSEMDKCVRNNNNNIMIVSSAGALICLIRNLFKDYNDIIHIPNCSITTIEYKDGVYQLLEVGKRIIEK